MAISSPSLTRNENERKREKAREKEWRLNTQELFLLPRGRYCWEVPRGGDWAAGGADRAAGRTCVEGPQFIPPRCLFMKLYYFVYLFYVFMKWDVFRFQVRVGLFALGAEDSQYILMILPKQFSHQRTHSFC